jgi:5-oxoprolinase (ATP-hydrolysing)
VVTAGLPDLLHIGNQSRPDIFDLRIAAPEALYEAVVEVDEAVMLPLGAEPSPRNGPQPELNARWAGSSAASRYTSTCK